MGIGAATILPVGIMESEVIGSEGSVRLAALAMGSGVLSGDISGGKATSVISGYQASWKTDIENCTIVVFASFVGS